MQCVCQHWVTGVQPVCQKRQSLPLTVWLSVAKPLPLLADQSQRRQVLSNNVLRSVTDVPARQRSRRVLNTHTLAGPGARCVFVVPLSFHTPRKHFHTPLLRHCSSDDRAPQRICVKTATVPASHTPGPLAQSAGRLAQSLSPSLLLPLMHRFCPPKQAELLRARITRARLLHTVRRTRVAASDGSEGRTSPSPTSGHGIPTQQTRTWGTNTSTAAVQKPAKRDVKRVAMHARALAAHADSASESCASRPRCRARMQSPAPQLATPAEAQAVLCAFVQTH